MGSQIGGLEIPDPCEKHIETPLKSQGRPVILRDTDFF